MLILCVLVWFFFIYKFKQSFRFSTSEMVYYCLASCTAGVGMTIRGVKWYEWFVFGMVVATTIDIIIRWYQERRRTNRINEQVQLDIYTHRTPPKKEGD